MSDPIPPRVVRLVLFVVTAFGFSWTLWILSGSLPSDRGAAATLDDLATFGPAIAAVLVGRGRRQMSVRSSSASIIGTVLVTVLVTSLLLAPRWAQVSSPLEVCLLAVLSLTPALLLWGAGGGGPRLSTLLRPLIAPRSPWWAYALALLLVPVASMLGTVLVVLVNGDVGRPPQVLTEGVWSAVPVVFALTLLFGGPLGEEIGWRGWLLPQLQAGLSPLLASLVVGVIWGCWHIPLHLRGVYDADMGSGLAGLALRIASSSLLAILFTWLYNRAHGGLLVVVLLHTSVNNTSGYWQPVNAGLTVVLLIVSVIVVLTDRMYVGPLVGAAMD